MTPIDAESKVKVGIIDAENNGKLFINISTGDALEANNTSSHYLSLAQARTLSLEIIKQVYRAELRSR